MYASGLRSGNSTTEEVVTLKWALTIGKGGCVTTSSKRSRMDRYLSDLAVSKLNNRVITMLNALGQETHYRAYMVDPDEAL